MIAIDLRTFVTGYWDTISGKPKTPEVLRRFMIDEELIGQIMAFEIPFPCFELIAEDYIIEEDKICVIGRVLGTHKGNLLGLPPTGKSVDLPFSVMYQIKDDMIVKSKLFFNQMELMNQLGYSIFN